MAWNEDSSSMVTGGNDNIVAVWDGRHPSTPVHRLALHTAAVKVQTFILHGKRKIIQKKCVHFLYDFFFNVQFNFFFNVER